MSDENNDQVVKMHPDLDAYLREGPFGLALDHPLVQELSIDLEYAAVVNSTYKHKSAELDKALRRRDWYSYVFLHERSHRFDAFMRIADDISSSRAYWELVRSVWIDSENVVRHDEEWFWLWNGKRRCKSYAMTAEDRKAFKQLPNELTIYRGIREAGNRYGLSWTLDRDKAVWFARRDGIDAGPVLLTACAKKCDVHALLLGRKESEIIIDEFVIIATEYGSETMSDVQG